MIENFVLMLHESMKSGKACQWDEHHKFGLEFGDRVIGTSVLSPLRPHRELSQFILDRVTSLSRKRAHALRSASNWQGFRSFSPTPITFPCVPSQHLFRQKKAT